MLTEEPKVGDLFIWDGDSHRDKYGGLVLGYRDKMYGSPGRQFYDTAGHTTWTVTWYYLAEQLTPLTSIQKLEFRLTGRVSL